MENNQIKIKVKEFRAVQEADIILDGITVVSGENGCGKSTLSKLLYYVFKISNQYEDLVYAQLANELRDTFSFLDHMRRTIDAFDGNDSPERSPFFYRRPGMYSEFLFDEKLLLKTIDSLSVRLMEFAEKNKRTSVRLRYNRIKGILRGILDRNDNENDKFLDLVEEFKSVVTHFYEESRTRIENRPVMLLNQSLLNTFNQSKLPAYYEILEYGEPIIASNSKGISKAHTVQKIAYIDTPVLFGLEDTEIEHWNDLDEILRKKENGFDSLISTILRNDVLKGETSYVEQSVYPKHKFVYKRDDGAEFDLADCATGVKSFSILQLLLKNGFLDKNTLLVIDEPEAHLHPQWIIEYARMIVLLNKHVGVKFFIASHNPDMVSAIKYISEKEKTESRLNFYLAVLNEGKYTYSYRSLGTGIDAIFESFNIALDRINLYGTTENDDDEIL